MCKALLYSNRIHSPVYSSKAISVAMSTSQDQEGDAIEQWESDDEPTARSRSPRRRATPMRSSRSSAMNIPLIETSDLATHGRSNAEATMLVTDKPMQLLEESRRSASFQIPATAIRGSMAVTPAFCRVPAGSLPSAAVEPPGLAQAIGDIRESQLLRQSVELDQALTTAMNLLMGSYSDVLLYVETVRSYVQERQHERS